MATVTIEIGQPAPVIPTTARVVIEYGNGLRAVIVWTYRSSLTIVRGQTNDRYDYVMTREDGSTYPGTLEVARIETASVNGWGYHPDAGPLTRAVTRHLSRILDGVLATDLAKESA